MLGRAYDQEACPAARALEIVGERWSLLILRNAAFGGISRFNEFQRSLGIAPNVLAARLEHLVAEGHMAVTAGAGGYPEQRHREELLDFEPGIVALSEWGDRWAYPDGPTIVYEHDRCGGRVRSVLRCERCGEVPAVEDVIARQTEVFAQDKKRRRNAAARPRRAR